MAQKRHGLVRHSHWLSLSGRFAPVGVLAPDRDASVDPQPFLTTFRFFDLSGVGRALWAHFSRKLGGWRPRSLRYLDVGLQLVLNCGAGGVLRFNR